MATGSIRGLGASWLVAALVAGALRAPAEAAEGAPNCRFGITAPYGAAGYDLASLGVGSYLDWGLRADPVEFEGVDYVQVVRLRDGYRRYILDPAYPALAEGLKAKIRAAARARPGAAWLVGNEPDTAYENQDSLTPGQYAEAYHEIYETIRSADPTARIGIGTIVQPTRLRMDWLDAMWSAYLDRYGEPPPSDFWSIHSFILREERGGWGTGIPPGLEESTGVLYTVEQTDDLAIFGDRLLAFRQWMAAKGERLKPLWITEYGSLLPHDGSRGLLTFPMARTREFMLGTFDFLLSARDPVVGYPHDDDRLVQRWYWYSLNDQLWHMGGSLYHPGTRTRTALGEAFAGYVASAGAAPDLLPVRVGMMEEERGDSLTYRYTVTVANAGGAALRGGYTVRLYESDPLTGGRPIGGPRRVWAELPGCGETRTILWPGVRADRRKMFVSVEPYASSGEIDRSNNGRELRVQNAP